MFIVVDVYKGLKCLATLFCSFKIIEMHRAFRLTPFNDMHCKHWSLASFSQTFRPSRYAMLYLDAI